MCEENYYGNILIHKILFQLSNLTTMYFCHWYLIYSDWGYNTAIRKVQKLKYIKYDFSWYTANNDTCPIWKIMWLGLTSWSSAYGKQNERNCHFPISYY